MPEDLREAVWAAYSEAAVHPERPHPFPVAGFRDAAILRTARNARTKSPEMLAAEYRARR
ncbi:MAG TPA: hypothetical protein VNY05_44720 [Candidatus Acidoferrales bacterium]|nr:hypothetical protein [Candidatus Acidoferrales bacterium]